MKKSPEEILNAVFGYEKFRPLQAEIIQNILKKTDTLVLMPTGGGKSLCYQIPALIFNGLTIVISPLISLMKDQVEQLVDYGVPAVYLNSSLSAREYGENMRRVRENDVKLLYLAPEALMKQDMLHMLSNLRVDCLTIDEAHCISEWGHDFRPEYRQLVSARALFPNAACVALTATATERVRKDIGRSLNFSTANEFVDSFDRNNLFLSIQSKNDPVRQTISFLNRFTNQSGIIYCFSRKQVESLSDKLQDEGFSVRPYHAGLSDAERKENQELFIRDDVQIIVATIAFGMGIDKPNVRFVIHFDLPKNVEGYYQEIGRAGRDGLRSECLLLFSFGDIQKIRHFIKQKEEPEKRVAEIHLQAMLHYCETDECRRVPLLTYFGEKYRKKECGMCDNCISEKEAPTDITIPAQKFLSCVKRSGEIFGAGHIIDILRGSEAKKIIKNNHQFLSTYGIGKEFSKKQWYDLSRQFLHKGYMAQDMDYGGLRLTPKAWDVFRGLEKVMGRVPEDSPVMEINEKKKKMPDEPDYDQALFEILRKKRKSLADKAKVPPYIIFSDKSLIEMAAYFPQSLLSFSYIHGVGDQKLKKYAFAFLEKICEYCETHHLEEALPFNRGRRKGSSDGYSRKPRHIEIGEAYKKGKSIDKIMKSYNIKLQTVLEHLSKFCIEGNSIETGGLKPFCTTSVEDRKEIYAAYDKLGTEFLAPVYQATNGKISYDDLKILRLMYLNK